MDVDDQPIGAEAASQLQHAAAQLPASTQQDLLIELTHLLPKQQLHELLRDAMTRLPASATRAAQEALRRHSTVSCPWNDRFQAVVDTIHAFGPNTPLLQKIAANLELSQLSRDFVYAARTYGRIIISERHLPVHMKTIKPSTRVGGIAGGEKYEVNGILFKFAVDSSGLYGSDWFAMKAASNELRGVTRAFYTHVKDIHVPLMAVVDYCGYRLTASAELPIAGTSTLVYGSNDSGHTVQQPDASQGSLMNSLQAIASRLRMKRRVSKNAVIFGPADLEVHYGTDMRHYMVDFGRMFPPDVPRRWKKGHLFYLLRPELLSRFSQQLCADTYVNFPIDDGSEEQRRVYMAEIEEANRVLLNEVIPTFASLLDSTHAPSAEHGTPRIAIAVEMHRRGINMRYLGAVLSHVRTPYWRAELLIETAARVAKNVLRALLRSERRRQQQHLLEQPYRDTVIAFLNRVFGNTAASAQWWTVELQRYMVDFFNNGLAANESAANLKNYLSQICPDALCQVFRRLQRMSCMTFLPEVQHALAHDPHAYENQRPFHDADLTDIGERVKHMGCTEVSEGFVLLCKAEDRAQRHEKQRLEERAVQHFEKALHSVGDDPTILSLAATAARKLGDYDRAMRYLERALDVDPTDIECHLQRAKIAMQKRDFATAAETCRAAIQVQAADPRTHFYLACCLAEQHSDDEARRVFDTALQAASNDPETHQYITDTINTRYAHLFQL